mmetsp:Transcript_36893/g.59684  ORF Transcript_36893/g.59684 Transcript_36893/m.59684 type:complete len:202 (+) Transcript_36893:472-1077(+)
MGIVEALEGGAPYRGEEDGPLLSNVLVLAHNRVLLGHDGHHDGRGSVSEDLLHRHSGVFHLVHQVEGDGFVVGSQSLLLFSNASQPVRVVGHKGQGPDEGRGGCVLAGKHEGHYCIGHRLQSLVWHLSSPISLDHVLDPHVDHTLRLSASEQVFMTVPPDLDQKCNQCLSRLDRLPKGCTGEVDGEGQEALVHYVIEADDL